MDFWHISLLVVIVALLVAFIITLSKYLTTEKAIHFLSNKIVSEGRLHEEVVDKLNHMTKKFNALVEENKALSEKASKWDAYELKKSTTAKKSSETKKAKSTKTKKVEVDTIVEEAK